jgi:hypothetical protein
MHAILKNGTDRLAKALHRKGITIKIKKSYNFIAKRFSYRLAAAVHMQLSVNISDISTHGIETDKTGSGDHFIAISFYQVLQNLRFPLRKIVLQRTRFCDLERL